MLNKLLLSTAIILAGGTASFAQGFSGAELGVEYTDVPDVEDLGGVSYYGSAEFDVAYGVAVALDLSAFDFDIGPSDVSNVTGHLIYKVDASTAVGLFFGQDSFGDQDADIFGGEVAYDFGLGDVQGYLGSASDAVDDDVTLYGAAGTYDLGNSFSFSANLNGFSGDGFSASEFEIGGFYQLAQGPRFGATIGQLNLDSGLIDDSETFFGIQASIGIGPNGGTTFGRRGIFEVIQSGGGT